MHEVTCTSTIFAVEMALFQNNALDSIVVETEPIEIGALNALSSLQSSCLSQLRTWHVFTFALLHIGLN